MSYIHEAAKTTIADVIERSAPVEQVAFRPYTPWGFCMVITAEPARYNELSGLLKALDLEPEIQRIRQSPTVWHYETVVAVPEGWQPPACRSAA